MLGSGESGRVRVFWALGGLGVGVLAGFLATRGCPGGEGAGAACPTGQSCRSTPPTPTPTPEALAPLLTDPCVSANARNPAGLDSYVDEPFYTAAVRIMGDANQREMLLNQRLMRFENDYRWRVCSRSFYNFGEDITSAALAQRFFTIALNPVQARAFVSTRGAATRNPTQEQALIDFLSSIETYAKNPVIVSTLSSLSYFISVEAANLYNRDGLDQAINSARIAFSFPQCIDYEDVQVAEGILNYISGNSQYNDDNATELLAWQGTNSIATVEYGTYLAHANAIVDRLLDRNTTTRIPNADRRSLIQRVKVEVAAAVGVDVNTLPNATQLRNYENIEWNGEFPEYTLAAIILRRLATVPARLGGGGGGGGGQTQGQEACRLPMPAGRSGFCTTSERPRSSQDWQDCMCRVGSYRSN